MLGFHYSDTHPVLICLKDHRVSSLSLLQYSCLHGVLRLESLHPELLQSELERLCSQLLCPCHKKTTHTGRQPRSHGIFHPLFPMKVEKGICPTQDFLHLYCQLFLLQKNGCCSTTHHINH